MKDTKLSKSASFHPQTNGLIEVVNMMIVHMLRMYNYKHPHTWDESLTYVKHSCNKSLHNSISHIPFGVCLEFQLLAPSLMLKLSLIEHPNLLSGCNTSSKKFMIPYKSPMPIISSDITSIEFNISFKVVTRSGYIYRKSTS